MARFAAGSSGVLAVCCLRPGWPARRMENCNYVHLARKDSIDNAIRSFNDFTNIGKFQFRNCTARARRFTNLLRATRKAINDAQRVFWGVFGDVFVNREQMLYGYVRPVDFHFGRSNRSRSSSTLMVRPASLAARPASIA